MLLLKIDLTILHNCDTNYDDFYIVIWIFWQKLVKQNFLELIFWVIFCTKIFFIHIKRIDIVKNELKNVKVKLYIEELKLFIFFAKTALFRMNKL